MGSYKEALTILLEIKRYIYPQGGHVDLKCDFLKIVEEYEWMNK